MGNLTVSAGVCGSRRDLDGPGLVRRADAALYRAKDGGRTATVLDPGVAQL